MSKYKLRWMQDFEIINMDFDNLGLAIKMLITLEDNAQLTVTKPTGSVHAYHMSDGKVELQQPDEPEDCEESVGFITGATMPTAAKAVEKSAFEIPTAINFWRDIDEYRAKIQRVTGITPQAALTELKTSPSDILESIRSRQKVKDAMEPLRQPSFWYDSLMPAEMYTRSVMLSSPVINAQTTSSLFANTTA